MLTIAGGIILGLLGFFVLIMVGGAVIAFLKLFIEGLWRSVRPGSRRS